MSSSARRSEAPLWFAGMSKTVELRSTGQMRTSAPTRFVAIPPRRWDNGGRSPEEHLHDESNPTDPNAAKSALTRREFLETAAIVTVAGSLSPRVWAAEIKNGIPYRTLGNTGENVSCIGLGGYHIGIRATSRKAFASSVPRSTKASISWITVGTTTAAPAKSAWARRCATDTARRPSS